MTNERYAALMASTTLELTSEEREEGWHWCADFDGLLVKWPHPGCCCE